MTKNECQQETLKHINIVRKFMYLISKRINKRALIHDQSKLQPPEIDIFTEYTPMLSSTTYGSDEYKKYLSEMQVALDHHYAVSPHHPEYSDYLQKEWKPMEQFNGEYSISNDGDIKDKYGILLTSFENPEGYLLVYILRRTYLIDELVCKTFSPTKKPYQSIIHKDCNIKNNNIANLEYSKTKIDTNNDIQNYIITCPALNIAVLDCDSMAQMLSDLNYNVNANEIDNYLHGKESNCCGLQFIGYKVNEYKPSNLSKMNLVDLIEMICDWKASSMRHSDGDIYKSIDINQNRFKYSDELKQILINTVKLMEDTNI